MPVVNLPDGTRLNFPDGMSQDDMASAINKLLAPGGESAAPKGNASQGRLDRFLQGMKDIPDAGAQMLLHALPEGVVNGVNALTQRLNDTPVIGPAMKALGMTPATPQEADQGLAKQEAQYQADRAASGNTGLDGWRATGNAAATLPLAAVSPVATGLRSAALIGAGTGAASGALQPVTDPNADFWPAKARQTGMGAAGGAVLGPVITQGARMVQPQVSDAVRYLMDRGVTPTPGQVLGGVAARTEEKLASVPLLGDMIKGAQRRAIGDFNRATYDEVLAPLGQKATGDVGRDAVAAIGDRVSAAYEALLPKLRFAPDQQFATEVQGLSGLVQGLPASEARQFNAFVNDRLSKALGNNGHMDGQTFKELESVLSKEIATFGRSQDAYQQKLADAFRTLQQALRDGLERSNPGAAQELGSLNRSWAMLTRLERAAGMQGAGEGVITPAQLASAVKAGDTSVRKRAYARGDALMQDLSDAGKSVLGSAYPDSGTAGRAILGGLLGGGAMIEPTTAAAVAAAALPYTRIGQTVLARALTRRPAAAGSVAAGMRAASPAIQAGLLGLLYR